MEKAALVQLRGAFRLWPATTASHQRAPRSIHQLPLIHAQELPRVRTESATSAIAASIKVSAALRGVVLGLWPQVAVDVQRDGGRGVPERVLHGHHIAPRGDEAARVVVAKVVQGELLHADRLPNGAPLIAALFRFHT